MSNKYNAQRTYWHNRCGYFKGKQALEDYFTLSKVENSGIVRDDFQVFDSGFEADIHRLLYQFVKARQELVLFTQVQVDLSQPKFCKLGYKVDFAVGVKSNAFYKTNTQKLIKTNFISYSDVQLYADKCLLVEAKGVFTPESRFKHLLLEWRGIQHGRDIEIVQATAEHVSRGTKCYKTLTPLALAHHLSKRFD